MHIGLPNCRLHVYNFCDMPQQLFISYDGMVKHETWTSWQPMTSNHRGLFTNRNEPNHHRTALQLKLPWTKYDFFHVAQWFVSLHYHALYGTELIITISLCSGNELMAQLQAYIRVDERTVWLSNVLWLFIMLPRCVFVNQQKH